MKRWGRHINRANSIAPIRGGSESGSDWSFSAEFVVLHELAKHDGRVRSGGETEFKQQAIVRCADLQVSRPDEQRSACPLSQLAEAAEAIERESCRCEHSLLTNGRFVQSGFHLRPEHRSGDDCLASLESRLLDRDIAHIEEAPDSHFCMMSPSNTRSSSPS